MALVDIAYEILRETNHPHNFRELMDRISALRHLTEEQKMGMIAQVYTEINIDGRFVCLGENTWGLKRWYPTDTVEETQEGGKKKKVVLDDDFDDDYEVEEDLVEEFEDEDIALFEEDEDFVDEDADIDDIDEDLETDEIVEEDEIFESDDEELEELDAEEELDEENDD
nr:DNA-directed RNA polymerase subunit delta [Brevibacillus fulvus]